MHMVLKYTFSCSIIRLMQFHIGLISIEKIIKTMNVLPLDFISSATKSLANQIKDVILKLFISIQFTIDFVYVLFIHIFNRHSP